MATVKLGTKAVGSVIKLKLDGVMRNFIVVHQGKPSSIYDASCDGTWLLLEDVYETRQWHSINTNILESSAIHTYLNGTFLNLFDADIKEQIKQVKLPYRKSGGTSGTDQSGSNGLSCKIFLLSGMEVGFTTTQSSYFPNDGAKLSYFTSGGGTTALNKRIANLNGSATSWWLRSPITSNTSRAWLVSTDGSHIGNSCSNSYGLRPALVLPPTLLASDDGTVTTNTAPTTPGSITILDTIQGGSTINVSWTASADAESNLEGYTVERSTDGGSTWTQIYQGGGLTTTNSVAFGTESVMYRVRAYDSEGLTSSWRTSGQVTVINNTAPTVPGSITVPEEVQGGQPLTIAWEPSSDGENNLAGYSLERQVDGGAWTAVFTGDALTFTDAITKGWQTVAYRVRAYDTVSAYSGFAVSETREVNNNTPPAIICDNANGSDLGQMDSGFEVSYSAVDEEGDEVAVTEAVDGKVWRTFSAVLGEENSFQVDGEAFMKVLNGKHTLTITAADAKSSAVHSLSFTKMVTDASVTLEQPLSADGPIAVCVMSVSGFIPADANYSVEVTNNANDDAPVWEDCTAAVRTGINHVFENEIAANGPAFNFRLHVSRGPSGLSGYITSVQGGFQ